MTFNPWTLLTKPTIERCALDEIMLGLYALVAFAAFCTFAIWLLSRK